MHIRQSIYIEATPAVAIESARQWMRDELQPLDTLPHMDLGEISDGITPAGDQSISTQIDQDGIYITTTVVGVPHEAGTKLTMDLRTQGDSFGARLRNLSLFPGRKLLLKQVKHSLLQIQEKATR